MWIAVIAISLMMFPLSGAMGQAQTPLPGSAIPQFVDEMPRLHTIVAGTGQIELQSTEFLSPVMPSTFVPAAGTYNGTWVWGYQEPGQTPGAYIGPVIVATRGVPTEVKWVNNLGSAATTNVLAYKNSVDQTIHWADPLNDGRNMCSHMPVDCVLNPTNPCCQLYTNTVPDVTHLHGGENPAEIDGGPEAWYTSNGSKHGAAFYSVDGAAATNYSIYRYPNVQDAASLWFHPHPLGVTRLNVYAGLAGAYVLQDPALNLPANLPGPADIIPVVLQDRMFDTNGQLYFPNLGINPAIHPYWIPEFVGDTIVINGKVWPKLTLEAKRYRFLFLNGSNARTYEMYFPGGPAFWVIGTDGGYLDKPVKVDPAMGEKLLIMPGERYDVIIDFAGYANKNLVLRNTGRTPFPKGPPPTGTTLGQLMKFVVGPAPAVPDASYNPAAPGAQLRLVAQQIVRLPGTPGGPAVTTANVQKIRQLTLNEVMGPGGPVEILVNNTKWMGHRINPTTGMMEPIPGSTLDTPVGMNYLTELPQEGETEVWEIVNLTADAHPIHVHLVQFQLMSRQNFNVGNYNKAYNALFPPSVQIDPMTGLPYPGGVFIGGYGPPLNYATGNQRALGGNPDVVPYLQNKPAPPLPHEQGWKDTTIMYPGTVTRIAVRFAPQGTKVNDTPLYYQFDPSGSDYVWHCHILDHEDNEMMRPYQVTPSATATRSYVKGIDF